MSEIKNKTVAVLCKRHYDFQVWLYSRRKDKVTYIWVYNLEKVRGRRFDGVELLADWYELKNADEILDIINKHLTKKVS